VAENRWTVAILPLSGPHALGDAYVNPVCTGQEPTSEVLAAMELFVILTFFLLLVVASAAGLTSDSRDGADWSATLDGRRQPRRP
jgi:hypothetical protein